MKLRNHWRETAYCMTPIAIAMLPFLILLLVEVFKQIAAGLCDFATVTTSAPQKLNGLRCTEFFINRYQSLLGVMGAFIVAYVAIKPVWRQVELMSSQTAMQLAPHIKERILQLGRDERLIAKLEAIDHCYYALSSNLSDDEPDGTQIKSLLLEVHEKCAAIDASEWDSFCERPDLPPEERELRRGVRKDFDLARRESFSLTKLPLGPALNDRVADHCLEMEREVEIAVVVLGIELHEYRSHLMKKYDELSKMMLRA